MSSRADDGMVPHASMTDILPRPPETKRAAHHWRGPFRLQSADARTRTRTRHEEPRMRSPQRAVAPRFFPPPVRRSPFASCGGRRPPRTVTLPHAESGNNRSRDAADRIVSVTPRGHSLASCGRAATRTPRGGHSRSNMEWQRGEKKDHCPIPARLFTPRDPNAPGGAPLHDYSCAPGGRQLRSAIFQN